MELHLSSPAQVEKHYLKRQVLPPEGFGPTMLKPYFRSIGWAFCGGWKTEPKEVGRDVVLISPGELELCA
jgi:hypothetical protein